MQRGIGISPKVTLNQMRLKKKQLIRELKEETGIIDAQFIDGFKETIAYFYRRQGLTVHKEVVFFIMESHTDKVTLSFEHIGFVWMDYAQAMEKLNFKNAKMFCRKHMISCKKRE